MKARALTVLPPVDGVYSVQIGKKFRNAHSDFEVRDFVDRWLEPDFIDRSNLKELAEGIRWKIRNDYDQMACISGREGIGKSNKAIELCRLVDLDFDVEKNIVYNLKELNKKIFAAPRYSAILIDEGMEVFYKRDWNNPARKRVLKTLAMARHRNLFYVFCCPRFTDLDEILRNWRIRIWLKMTARGEAYTYTFDDDADFGDPWHLHDARLKYSRNYWHIVRCSPTPTAMWNKYQKIKEEYWDKVGAGEIDDRVIMLGKILAFTKRKLKLSDAKLEEELDIPKSTIGFWIRKYKEYELA